MEYVDTLHRLDHDRKYQNYVNIQHVNVEDQSRGKYVLLEIVSFDKKKNGIYFLYKILILCINFGFHKMYLFLTKKCLSLKII